MNRMSIRRLHMGCGESLMPLLPQRYEKKPLISLQQGAKRRLKRLLKRPVRHTS